MSNIIYYGYLNYSDEHDRKIKKVVFNDEEILETTNFIDIDSLLVNDPNYDYIDIFILSVIINSNKMYILLSDSNYLKHYLIVHDMNDNTNKLFNIHSIDMENTRIDFP